MARAILASAGTRAAAPADAEVIANTERAQRTECKNLRQPTMRRDRTRRSRTTAYPNSFVFRPQADS